MKTQTSVIIILLILITLIGFISFSDLRFATAEDSHEYDYSWTKGICNDTHCQDYELYCNNGELIRESPITGAVISIPEDWEDPRDETSQKRVCDY